MDAALFKSAVTALAAQQADAALVDGIRLGAEAASDMAADLRSRGADDVLSGPEALEHLEAELHRLADEHELKRPLLPA